MSNGTEREPGSLFDLAKPSICKAFLEKYGEGSIEFGVLNGQNRIRHNSNKEYVIDMTDGQYTFTEVTD